MEIASYELNRVERSSSTFTVIIFDIDFFKRINDEYGHHTGDRVLINVSDTLRTSIKNDGIVSRWGGEEFLILCPKTTQDEALKVAERIQKKIKNGYIKESTNIITSIVFMPRRM